MKHPILVFTFSSLATLLSGQGAAEDRTLRVDSDTREYVIDVPSSYDSSSPYSLLLCFHGLGGTAANTRAYARFFEQGDLDKFITAYPQGMDIPNPLVPGTNAAGWVFAVSGNRDVTFVAALLDSLENEFNITPGAVFVSGVSNGGFFCDILGCTLGDRLSAIGPIVGGYPLLTGCSVTQPLPVFRLGTVEDELVQISYLRDATAFWVAHNGCDAAAVQDGMCAKYGGCDNGAEVIHCEYACRKSALQPGCHTWPMPPTYDFSTTEMVLEFFRDHGLGGASASAAPRDISRAPESHWFTVTSAAGATVRVDLLPASVSADIFSLDGKRVESVTVGAEQTGCEIHTPTSGAYVCRLLTPGGVVWKRFLVSR